jgi:hypothetical protein
MCCVLLFIVYLSFSLKYSKDILGKCVQTENIRRSNNYLKEQYLLMLNTFPQNIDSISQCLDSINWGETNAHKHLVAVLNPTCAPCALDFLNMYNAMALSNSIKVHVFFAYWTKEQHEKLELLVSAILQNPNKAMYVICDVDDECGIGERTTMVVDAGSRDDGRQERRLFLYR